MSRADTSWEESSTWYDQLVGAKGHYYHHSLIIPRALCLLQLDKSKLLDLGCGQGVFSRALPSKVGYVGIDISPTLIRQAEKLSQEKRFLVADITKPLPLEDKDFTHALFLLSLQNIQEPRLAIEMAKNHLTPDGQILIILNHPCFRIPRQTSWHIDQRKELQSRLVDRYLSSMKIPLQTHPGKGRDSPTTLSFHHPISAYSEWLYHAGFRLLKIEEWVSDKKSTGKWAKMEDAARREFPLFLALLAQKTTD